MSLFCYTKYHVRPMKIPTVITAPNNVKIVTNAWKSEFYNIRL